MSSVLFVDDFETQQIPVPTLLRRWVIGARWGTAVRRPWEASATLLRVARYVPNRPTQPVGRFKCG
jgi:hypothetical protein